HNSIYGIMKSANVVTTIAQITDGTSNTLLLTEIAGKPRWYVNGKEQPIPAYPVVPSLEGRGWGHLMFRENWLHGSHSTATANGTNLINTTNRRMKGEGCWGFYSFHRGGVSVALGDASVRFLSASTSGTTIIQLVTRDGGEVPGSDL